MERKFGKRPARYDPRTLKLAKYLTPALTPPPLRCRWSRGFNINWGMMLNDDVGDCTEAAKGHTIQTLTMDNGRRITVPDSVVLAQYEANGGYNPNDPSTDQGEDELTTLNIWRKSDFGGFTLTAYADPSPTNQLHVMQAIYLFGGVYIGFQVPQSAMDQNDAGETWDVVTPDGGIVGGHAVWVPDYDDVGLWCITWGMLQRMTWNFFFTYVDEVHALLVPAWLNAKNIAPNAVDLAALTADQQLVIA